MRLAPSAVLAVTVALAAATTALDAAAQPGPRGREDGSPQQREYRDRDFRGPGERRGMMPPDDMRRRGMPPEDMRGRGHMLSPEERRQLRRDIDDAGRDLYRDPPRRGGRQR